MTNDNIYDVTFNNSGNPRLMNFGFLEHTFDLSLHDDKTIHIIKKNGKIYRYDETNDERIAKIIKYIDFVNRD